jgi:O-6-methylguanine DNA methyltransferase
MSVLPTDTHEEDPLATELAALSAPAPTNFADQVIARWVEVDGPLGSLYVAFTDRGIASVCPVAWVDGADRFAESFRSRFGRPLRPAARPPAGLAAAVRAGRGTGLEYDLRAVGEFDRAVLAKTLEIPRGEVRPYSWIAREIGHPRAVRAAGSALGRNPVPILIPCHRVVRSDGATGNYGFGAERKVELLRTEQVDLDTELALGRRGIHYLASDTTGIYCYPSCAHARRITAAHRVELANTAAATAGGYRPCRHCRPGLG